MQLKASAPGSLMLLGEYAVLYGKHAIVCAIDKRITVTLTPRTDDVLEIESTLHGSYTTNITDLKIEKPFHFILGAFKQFQGRIKRGCHVEITSEFSDKIGLGSSAAVTSATLAAIVSWLNIRVAPLDLIRQGRNVVRSIQGMGSGADIAASVYGGVVGYQGQPLSAERFSTIHPMTALYAGFKTPTVEAIKRVQTQFNGHPNLFRHIQNTIGQCSLEGINFLRRDDWGKLGEIMNIQQGLLESLGVSTPLIRDMVEDLRRQPSVVGAKISGSGLGDCVIGLGEVPENYEYLRSDCGVQQIPIAMTLQGVQCDKI